MNKQTFPIVIACLLALFGVQYAVNKIYPPIPRPPRPVPALVPAPVTTSATRPAEQIVTLSNDCVRVEITSWGGAVKSVDLLKYHTVLSGPALTLPGDDIFTIEQSDARTVVLRGTGVTKTLTLGDDYRLTGKFVVPAGLTNLLITVGTAAPADAKEAPNYLNVDWQGGPKFSNGSE